MNDTASPTCAPCAATTTPARHPRPSVDHIAAQVHEQWRAERDRSYSPFNKPWGQLSYEERRQVSRQSATSLQLAGVDFQDEYSAPTPPPEPSKDPETAPASLNGCAKQFDAAAEAARDVVREINRTVNSPQVRADTLRLQSVELATEAVKAIADIASAALGTPGVPVVGVIRM